MLLYLLVKLLVIFFTANGPWNFTDGSMPTIFTQKEQKEELQTRSKKKSVEM